MANAFNLTVCVPRFNGEYLRDTLAKYDYVVRIDARNMELTDLLPIEKWCDEYFGKLNECSDTSPWQVSIEEHYFLATGSRKSRELCFHFHNELSAMAFKLRWI